MSYSQTFKTTLTVSGSVSVSYPKSDSGGSTSATYRHTEELEFVIDVDTNPVDAGVLDCHTSIAGLNAAVVAGADLQIREKTAGAERVSSTVIHEFNNYIAGDIRQELASLKSQIAAKQALLHAEAQVAGSKHQQFLADYRRIKERYADLFRNLDKELERRVRAIDEPVFQLVRDSFGQGLKARASAGFASSVLGSAEGDLAVQNLENTAVKRRNLELLRLAGRFLVGQKELEGHIQEILIPVEAEAAELSVPFVCLETEDKNGVLRSLKSPENGPKIDLEPGRVWEEQTWAEAAEDERMTLERTFLNHLGAQAGSLNERELITLRTLWSECHPQTNEA